MCTTNIYTYVRPDGRKEQFQSPTLCSASRHGQPCAGNIAFQHPEQFVPYADASQQLPPTPTYTPRSGTPIYRSGDESDRSYHSASSASRNKRPSGVYVNGQRVLDLNRRNERHSSGRRERIVLVDSPPTPRTPPQTYTAPHTAPSSPNFPSQSSPYIINADPKSHQRRASVSHHASRRPVIVDERPRTERPRVQIEVVDAAPGRHARHSSTSSREHSSSSAAEDEERRKRRRRQQQEEQRARDEAEIREQRLRARIARANAEIANRPPVPMPPAPPKRSDTYTRPAVEVPYNRDAELVEAVQRLNLREDKARRAAEKAEREEEAAQRQRLMERMMPRRRATVGPGSRRHRVLYDDGVYRWE